MIIIPQGLGQVNIFGAVSLIILQNRLKNYTVRPVLYLNIRLREIFIFENSNRDKRRSGNVCNLLKFISKHTKTNIILEIYKAILYNMGWCDKTLEDKVFHRER